MNAKRCKKLRAAFRVWDASEQRWTINQAAYHTAKKMEAARLAAARSGQKPKPVACRTPKPKDPQPRASSVWKRTGPLFVVKPYRQTHEVVRIHRRGYGRCPKHLLDFTAQQHPVGVA